MATTNEKGTDAEKFVLSYTRNLGLISELHPRSSRPAIGKDGKPVYFNGRPLRVSMDNDYHNVFDVKSEGPLFMIYIQSKFEKEKSHSSTAQKEIDKAYPYEFTYQKLQVWMIWKEWVSKPRRHKEFKFRIFERHGFLTVTVKGKTVRKGNWEEISPNTLLLPMKDYLDQYIPVNYELDE